MIRAENILSGAYAKLYFDGLLVAEVEGVSAKVEYMRTDVMFGPDVDSKIVGQKGTGSLVLKKVYSALESKLLEVAKTGRDFRPVLDQVINDPSAIKGQREHVTIPGIWFNNFDLAGFKRGEEINREFDFGFRPSDVQFQEGVY